MPPKFIMEPAEFPTEVILDADAVGKLIPHRGPMALVSAVTHIDPENHIIVGYKDVGPDEFWVAGHMPDYPLMPGVLMCEIAAQLASVYTRYCGLNRGEFIALGGLDDVRFRGMVRPGDRFWVVGRTEKHSLRRMVFQCQGFVNEKMVFNAQVTGIPLSPSQGEPGADE